jgi:hypothetical protein
MITGELAIARRPLSDDERGIAIMIGNHIVLRTSFGFESKLSRVTGYVRQDSLTSRFADKSAIIEDEEYDRFYKTMRSFIAETVIPSLAEYEDVLITREESKLYKQIDKVLGQAVIETLEPHDEIEGYEIVETTGGQISTKQQNLPIHDTTVDESNKLEKEYSDLRERQKSPFVKVEFDENDVRPSVKSFQPTMDASYVSTGTGTLSEGSTQITSPVATSVRRPILKKTFVLKKIGYKVIPYEDESDSRYSFVNESVVFVNKANLTYKAESSRGEEFLLRHIMNIVAQAIAESRHPEGKDALDLQNRLISEAIRIHDGLSRFT